MATVVILVLVAAMAAGAILYIRSGALNEVALSNAEAQLAAERARREAEDKAAALARDKRQVEFDEKAAAVHDAAGAAKLLQLAEDYLDAN